MTRKLFAAVAYLLLTATYLAAQPYTPVVELRIEERLGIPRKGEIVTTGVPLPAGEIQDSRKLGLIDVSGKPVPAEIRPVLRWPDNSLKWVHLYFSTDVAADGSSDVKLVKIPNRRNTSIPLSVAETDDSITVTTGPLKFVVKKKAFNLVDTAWLDTSGNRNFNRSNLVVPSHSGGLIVQTAEGAFHASKDKDVKVEVEEKGPMHAVLRAKGSYRNKNGDKRLDFVTRIYAYAGSPYLRLVHSVINAQGAEVGSNIEADSIRLRIPTAVSEKSTCTVGTSAGSLGERRLLKGISDDKPGSLYAPDAMHLNGRKHEPPLFKDPVGWLNISDGTKKLGLAAGIRWFRQMYPKALSVDREGTLTISIQPEQHPDPLKLYAGVSRTHDILLYFHDGRRWETGVGSAMAHLGRPLRAFAPPSWYSQRTHAFGKLMSADLELYKEEYRDAVNNYDQDFYKSYLRGFNYINGREKRGVTRSSYGVLAWGDGFHYALAKNDPRPINLMWAGNYYGYPHMMCAQWARTGKWEYLDMFQTHARHVADVHTVHYAPDPKWRGANRYCPPPEHVRMHKHGNPDKNPVYISNTFNHHKSQSLFERWYLLADHRMLDVIDEIGGYIMRYPHADNDPRQPRGPGFLMITLAELCDFHSRSPKWIKRYKKAFEASYRNHKKYRQNYQLGFWLEGIRRYYETTEDDRALELLHHYCDRIMKKRNAANCNMAHAFGFLYGQTGKEDYRSFGARSVKRSRPGYGNAWKDFASNMRSGMYMLYWLAEK